jgi:hypothetical protein
MKVHGGKGSRPRDSTSVECPMGESLSEIQDLTSKEPHRKESDLLTSSELTQPHKNNGFYFP